MPNDEIHDHILPGAFGEEPKTVPLVVYEMGQRRVVGEATITPDTTGFRISATVTDPEMKKVVESISSSGGRRPEMGIQVTPEERQSVLLDAMRRKGSLTVTDGWEVGYALGFYRGGDAFLVKTDLNALAKRNQAVRHDGFWRHSNEPDRNRYKRWGDYWTPKGR